MHKIERFADAQGAFFLVKSGLRTQTHFRPARQVQADAKYKRFAHERVRALRGRPQTHFRPKSWARAHVCAFRGRLRRYMRRQIRRLSPKISRGPSARHHVVFQAAENDPSPPRPENHLVASICAELKKKKAEGGEKTCLDSRFRSHEMERCHRLYERARQRR